MSAPFVKTKQELTYEELYTLGEWCETGNSIVRVAADVYEAMICYKKSAKLAKVGSKYGAYDDVSEDVNKLMEAMTSEKNREKARAKGAPQEDTAEDSYIAGLAFEKGFAGAVDIKMAMACYKQSAKASIAERKANVARGASVIAARKPSDEGPIVGGLPFTVAEDYDKFDKEVAEITAGKMKKEERGMVDVAASFLLPQENPSSTKAGATTPLKTPPSMAAKASMGSPDVLESPSARSSMGSYDYKAPRVSDFVKGDEDVTGDATQTTASQVSGRGFGLGRSG